MNRLMNRLVNNTGARPLLLDLFCGAGGAAMGYHRAGFDVIGVDINPQPNYPFPFYRDDALGFLREHGDAFDLIHASPPCQAGTGPTLGCNAARNRTAGRTHPRLITPIRDALHDLGVPHVIENVQTSTSVGPDLGVRPDVALCGDMFPGLAVIRHRFFETSGFLTLQPPHTRHRGRVSGMRHGQWFTGPYFAVYGDGGGKGTITQWQNAMGIDWTTRRRELAEAIPPAYTHHIGDHAIRQLTPAGAESAAA